MARRSKNRSLRLTERLLAPFVRLGEATGNSARRVGRGVGNIAGKTVGMATNVTRTFGKKTNQAIRNMTSGRKSRRNRKGNMTRRSRR